MVIAPSNPVVSIGPLLAIPGVRDALVDRRSHAAAISPIIAGKALKGPADRLMAELGMDASVLGVADVYRDLAATIVIDDADAHQVAAIEASGLRCICTDTIMKDAEVAAALASTIIEGVLR